MIVSTTLTGNNADIIGDALASVVGHVDRCIVIDTGVRDASLDVARTVAGDKLVVRELAWTNDFAAARNFALDAAGAAGATWAITVDTDERLVVDPGLDLRSELAATTKRTLLVTQVDGTYAKERIIRLPCAVRWEGPTHERLVGQRDGESAVLAGVRFSELPKDGAAFRRKFERDVEILRTHTRRFPSDPRWHYYLGSSLHGLERWREAIDAYEACARLRGWAEEAAWACFRAAECWCALQQWDQAVQACADGLVRRPATAELAWLAGWASYQAGRHRDAVAWSQMAAANGRFAGAGAHDDRISFRQLPALYEGPYDVLRWAYAALGDQAAADRATQDYMDAKHARLGGAGT